MCARVRVHVPPVLNKSQAAPTGLILQSESVFRLDALSTRLSREDPSQRGVVCLADSLALPQGQSLL